MTVKRNSTAKAQVGQLLLDAFRVRRGRIDLVDSDDDRHLRRGLPARVRAGGVANTHAAERDSQPAGSPAGQEPAPGSPRDHPFGELDARLARRQRAVVDRIVPDLPSAAGRAVRGSAGTVRSGGPSGRSRALRSYVGARARRARAAPRFLRCTGAGGAPAASARAAPITSATPGPGAGTKCRARRWGRRGA